MSDNVFGNPVRELGSEQVSGVGNKKPDSPNGPIEKVPSALISSFNDIGDTVERKAGSTGFK